MSDIAASDKATTSQQASSCFPLPGGCVIQSLDQDGDLGDGHPLEEGIGLSHRRAGSEEATELRVPGHRQA